MGYGLQVGYTAYPDNVVEEFVKSANEGLFIGKQKTFYFVYHHILIIIFWLIVAGVDVFRVFDSLNDVEVWFWICLFDNWNIFTN